MAMLLKKTISNERMNESEWCDVGFFKSGWNKLSEVDHLNISTRNGVKASTLSFSL